MKRFSQPTVNVTRRRGVGVGGSNSAVVRVSYHRQSQLWLYVLETDGPRYIDEKPRAHDERKKG
jgi:hypothetical protein